MTPPPVARDPQAAEVPRESGATRTRWHSEPAVRAARRALAPLLLVALATPAGADLVVRRDVRADPLVRPGREGAATSCPSRVERPRSGERVRLSIAPDRARRDEAAVSFVVDLGAARAFVVDHRARTWSELAYPLRARELADPALAGLRAEGEALVAPRRLAGVFESVANLAGSSRVTRAARVASGSGSELEVEAEVLPEATLGPAALAVETFAQAVRGAGESWLLALELPAGVPLGLLEELQQRRSAVRYRESPIATESAQLDPALFAPPADYTKVPHRPECF